MKIGIAGAGIGGLTAAALLHDAGHDVQLFDQFTDPQPVGSGLVIQPVGQMVLHRLGLRDTAVQQGTAIHRMIGHSAPKGRGVLDVSYGRKGDGVFGLGIHRSSLFDVLFNAVKTRDIQITPNFKVAQRQDNALVSTDGATSDTFDLIVDALGATSPLSPMQAKPLAFGAVWGTVDWDEGSGLDAHHLTQRYFKAQNMVGVLPCGLGKAAIFWSLPVDHHDRFRADGLAHWKSAATALWPEFAPFADQVADMDQLTWAQYSHGTLRKMWSTGMVHIGDAAHRASPQLGQGANMAMLDAAALTWAVEKYEGNAALKAYRKTRMLHIRAYQTMSWAFTPMYQSSSTILPWLRDWVLYPTSQIPPISTGLTHVVRGDIVRPMRGIR